MRYPRSHVGERRERDSRQFGRSTNDQPTTQSRKYCEILCGAVEVAAGFTATRQRLVDLATSDAVSGLHGSDVVDQGRQFGTRRLDDP
jgi:hypothetical protein